MRLTDRIHLVASGAQGFGLTHPSDCHAYLIDGGSEAALIDAGSRRGAGALLATSRGDRGRAAACSSCSSRTPTLITQAAPLPSGKHWASTVACSPEVADILRSGDEARASVDVGKAQGAYAPDYTYRATEVERELQDGQRVRVGDLEVEVVATPGPLDRAPGLPRPRDGSQRPVHR